MPIQWRLRIENRNARHVQAVILVGGQVVKKAGSLVLSLEEEADLARRLGALVEEVTQP